MDLFWDRLLILPAGYPSAPWCGSTDPGSAPQGSPPCRWCLVGTPQQQPRGGGEQPSWRGGSCLSADGAHLCCSYMSSPPSTDTPSLRFVFFSFITEFSLESHSWCHGYFLVLLFPSKSSFFIYWSHFSFLRFFFLLADSFNHFNKVLIETSGKKKNKNPIWLSLALGLKSSDLKSWSLDRGRWIVWPVGGCRGSNNNASNTSWR